MSVIKNSLLLVAFMYGFSVMNAQGSNSSKMSLEVKEGMAYFQGEKRFENHGPSCLSCHNISNENMALGGTFAKDLTDVYSRLGEGLTVWLTAPPHQPMVTSYQNNELTEIERKKLTAFFKYTNEVGVQSSYGIYTFLVGSLLGLVLLLGVFSFVWRNRKYEMVKQDIFDRSMKASDAKF